MRIEITLKNYRCFPDRYPAKFVVGDGWTAFLGVNNAGKSALLRFFYEFRPFLQALGDTNNRLRLVRGHGITPGYEDCVKDPTEVFHNQNDRPLTIEFRVSDPKQYPNQPYPNPTSVTFELRPQEPAIVRVTRLVFGDKAAFPLGNMQTEPVDTTLRLGNIQVDLAQYLDAMTRLYRTFYVGAFRNALNTGAKKNYFDIQVGDAFIRRWRAMQTGDNLREKRVCKEVVSAIERLFGYDRLDIHANDTNDTLQVDVNNRPYRLDEHGAGLAQFIMVLVNAAVEQPAYILIDEPELNLHPSLQIEFLTALDKFAEHGLVFATHSIGLARATADRVYALTREGHGVSRVRPYEELPHLSEFLGSMSFSSYQALGFTKVLLAEGPTDVRAVQQFLRKHGRDHHVLVLPLGGSSGIKERSQEELNELKRITTDVSALIDSEKDSEAQPLSAERAAFRAACEENKFPCHILKFRALENYLTEAAIRQVKGPKYRALGPYENLKHLDPGWGKHENWKIAAEMSLDDIKDTDLGEFLATL
jgi:ABC-type Na+ transport system ATPase subunit NatA